MSSIKYMSSAELLEQKAYCEKILHDTKCTISGQQKKLKWLNRYLAEKNRIKELQECRFMLKVILSLYKTPEPAIGGIKACIADIDEFLAEHGEST